MPLELEELDARAPRPTCDAAIVAYPHGASSPASWRRSGRAELKVVDLSADFRLRDLRRYARWYGEHEAPELLDDAVYGLTELYRDEVADADLVANPGCYPTADAAGARAAGPRRPDRRRRRRRQVGRVGRRPRALGQRPLRHRRTRTSAPTASRGHRHARRDRPGARAAGRAGRPPPSRRTCVPLDQGELVSCYVTPDARDRPATSSPALYADAYVGEPFVELTDRPPGVRDVRDTNICRISRPRGSSARASSSCSAAIDNLWKGAASQAVQNLNLMLGLGEGEGITSSRSSTRAGSTRPDHVAELDRRGLPAGLPRRRGSRPGSSPAASPTSACSCATAPTPPAPRASPARACSPRRCCSPRSAAASTRLRAVVANSGNANAATGRRGLDAAAKMQGAAAVAGGVAAERVAVCSTGVIGVQLDADAIVRALPDVRAELSRPRRRAPSPRRS